MNDFYQSPADKMRLEVLLNSLLEGRLNLAILGHDDIALAHYARMIHEHLRKHGQRVELWSSAESDQLVERFNRILSDLTLKEAQDKLQTSADRLYLIFPDTHAIADFELQLLARLVNGFPASNINVILLINRLEPFERKLQAFGKNLLQWILESEHPIPDRLTQIEVKSDEEPALKAAPGLDELESKPGADAPSWHPSSQSSAEAGQRKRKGKGVWLVLLALLLSLGIFAAMKWSAHRQEAAASEATAQPSPQPSPVASTAPTSATSEASPAESPSAAGGGMSSSANQPIPAQESLTAGKEELVGGKPPGTAVAPSSAATSPTSTPTPAAATAVAPASSPTSPPAQAEPAAKAKPKSDRDWVMDLKPGQWVLQLAALDTLDEAKRVINESMTKDKDQLRILMAPRNGGSKHYYIVIRGPIDAKETAESLMKTDSGLSKAWMRSAKSMKSQFDKP